MTASWVILWCASWYCGGNNTPNQLYNVTERQCRAYVEIARTLSKRTNYPRALCVAPNGFVIDSWEGADNLNSVPPLTPGT